MCSPPNTVRVILDVKLGYSNRSWYSGQSFSEAGRKFDKPM